MAAADEEAALGEPKVYLYSFDLVGFGRGRHKRGLALSATEDADDGYRILRIDGSVVTKKASDIVGIFDRSLVYVGRIVESVCDVGGQIGVITGVTTTLDVVQLNDRLGATKVVKRVSPADLRRVRALSIGDYVVSGQWLGRVVTVSLDIEISFDDGAVCRVADPESKQLRPDKGRTYLPETNTAFYPGARILTVNNSSAIFTEARWLNGQWKPDREEGKVSKVEMVDVFVCWFASAGYDMESAPPANQNPDDLTFFCSAPDNTWGFGDRCFLRADMNHHQDEQQSSAQPPTMTVSFTTTSVEVLWQDGTRQQLPHSFYVYPVDVEFLSDIEFFPGQYVVANSLTDDIMEADVVGTGDDLVPAAGGSNRRVGIVRSLTSKEHMVRVSWLKAAATGPDNSWEVDCDDTVSAYELGRHPDHYVFYGDIVVRLLSSDAPRESTTLGQQLPQAKSAPADLSWVGHVVDLHDGYVQVKWGDGSTSTVLPHEIGVPHNEQYAQLRAEMNGWVEQNGVDAPQELGVSDVENDQHDQEDATDIEGGRVEGSDGSTNELVGTIATLENVDVFVHMSAEDPSIDFDARETRINVVVHDGSDEDSDMVIKSTTGDDCTSKFPRFDVTKSPQDHHYLDIMEQGSDSRGKSWSKAVQKEWKILLNDLPDTIYVRAFEDRMDLLRAVMVGASGTPYQDGLFFFDLQLPPSYPAEPPQVYYHSFGLRLNPNLYESGTVCLSLLNTFGGEGTEVWSPATSSLLQVLVSIQGLVLNDQPYYNEPVYEALVGTPKGRRNALPYGENAYLLNLRTMIYLLRRPPQGFEEFVKHHFRRWGQSVLKTCRACLQGCTVATLAGDGRATEADKEESCSAGLKLALTNLVPSLVAAFMDIGAEGCDDFQLKSR